MKAKLIALINQMDDHQVEKLLADMDDDGGLCPKTYDIKHSCSTNALARGECFSCWTDVIRAIEPRPQVEEAATPTADKEGCSASCETCLSVFMEGVCEGGCKNV